MNATNNGGWWSRIGGVGQVTLIAALLGLVATTIPVVFSLARADADDRGPGPAVTVIDGNQPTTGTTTAAAKTPPATTPAGATPIQFTIHDQLTEGVEEETIVVTLEGVRVATLTASRATPTVSQRVTGSRAGNYTYVLDAELYWYDDDGALQRTVTSGRGSAYIESGMQLDVYLHIESNGVSLSLGSR
jgi:hypothetical protein